MGKIGQQGCESYPKLAVKPSFLQDAEALGNPVMRIFRTWAVLLFSCAHDEPNERDDALQPANR